MKCKYCGNVVESDSVFCRFCGERLARVRRREKDEARELTVPKPKQLASGEWSAQLMIDGSRERVKGATEAEYYAKARALKAGVLAAKDTRCLTLGDAIDAYLRSHSELLSKATIKAYKSMRKHRFQRCMGWNIYEPHDWQSAVNAEKKSGLNARSVQNGWAMVRDAFKGAKLEAPKVDLPRKIRKAKSEHKFLNYKQIDTFLAAIKGDKRELGALLALHSCRMSELMAVTRGGIDLDAQVIQIRGARIVGEDGKLVYQELNKESASRRDIPILIPRLAELVRDEQPGHYLVQCTGRQLYYTVNRICRDNDLPEVGVHGLRHSFASLAYHLGWKQLTTMEVGGWSDSDIVNEIYTHNSDYDDDVAKMKQHFSGEG